MPVFRSISQVLFLLLLCCVVLFSSYVVWRCSCVFVFQLLLLHTPFSNATFPPQNDHIDMITLTPLRSLHAEPFLLQIDETHEAWFEAPSLATCWIQVKHPFYSILFYLYLYVYVYIDVCSKWTRRTRRGLRRRPSQPAGAR